MPLQKLFIQQLVFDVHFFQQEGAYQFQNQVSKLYSNKLHQIINDFFEAAVPAEVIVKLSSLQLDLGKVAYDDMEEEIALRLLKALQENFTAHKWQKHTGVSETNNYTIEPLQTGVLQLFEAYLSAGILPWWASPDTPFASQEEAFRKLMVDTPAAVRMLLMRIGQDAGVRKRIAWQLSKETIQAIIQVLEPGESDFICGYQIKVGTLQQNIPVVQAELKAFTTDVWYFILTFLMKEHGSNFSRKEFVKSTLKQIAARYNVRYEKLLVLFNEATDNHPGWMKQVSLVQTIKEIYREENIVFDQEPAKDLSVIPDETGLRLLHHFLLYGSFPDEYLHFGTTGITGFFEVLAKRQPGALRAMLMSVPANNITVRLLQEHTAIFEQLVHLLQPHFASRILENEIRLKQMLPAMADRQLLNGLPDIQSTAVSLLLATTTTFDYNAFINQWLELVANKTGVPTDAARQWMQSNAVTAGPVDSSALHHAGSMAPNAVQIPAISENLDGEKGLLSVLRYFIATGTYPWWAEAFREKKPEELLMDLCALHPVEAVRLFQFAGGSTQRADRFLYQFPVSLTLKIIGLLPGGQNAVNAYLQILNIYEWTDLPDIISLPLKERFLLKLIWQYYLTNKYSSFQEPVFYVEAIRQLCLLSNTPPDELLASAADLMQQYDGDHLKNFLEVVRQLFVHHRSRPVITHLPDETLITCLKKMVDAESVRQVYAKKADVQELGEMLIHTATYLFTHNNLPPDFGEPTGFFTWLSLLKAVLIKLWHIDSTALHTLLKKYYYQPGMPQKLHSLFEMDDAAQKAILLQLNRLHFKTATAVNSSLFSETIQPTLFKDVYDGAGFPLLQKYFINNVVPDRMAIERTIVELLHYFLTWQVLPESQAGKQDRLPVTAILKETLYFLYRHNKSALKELLLKTTHLPPARIQLYGLFAKPVDSYEIEINKLLSSYLQSDLLNHFYTSGNLKTPEQTIAINVSGLPDAQMLIAAMAREENSIVDEENLVQKATEIMKYFLTYNKLPEDVDPVHSKADTLLKAVFRLLFNSRAGLTSLLARQNNHPEAKMRLYEWFESSPVPEDKNIVLFTHEMLQKDFVGYLQHKLDAGLPKEGNTINQLFYSITNMQEPELRQVLTMLLAHPAGSGVLRQYFKDVEIYNLLEKANKTWAVAYLSIVRDLRLLFERTLHNSSHWHPVNTLLLQFSLLSFSGKITIGDAYLFITRFFAYADEQLPVLVPDMYRQLQNYRLYTTSITLFANPALSMHLQQEIAQRLLYSNIQLPHSDEKLSQPVTDTRLISPAIAVLPNGEVSETTAMQNKNAEVPPVITDRSSNTSYRKSDAVDEVDQISASRNALDKPVKKRIIPIQVPEKPEKLVLPQKNLPVKAPGVEGAKIYIQNAGLVLLHPFIPTLFAHCGLTKEKHFTDDESLFKAIHLLQYLVDGSMDHEEHLLPLNKIICGVPLPEPVPKTVLFTIAETDLCESLFKMIFQRWDKMKNSSIEGFRRSFLQRPGMLMRTNDNWTLRVEQRSYDVLLQTLPWAYTIMRLPWMSEFLYVEWI